MSVAHPSPAPGAVQRAIGIAASAALPLATSLAYAIYALAPDLLPADFSHWAVLMLFAEMPLCLMGGVFAGVAAIPGSALRRVLVYLVILAVVVLLGGFWELFNDDTIGPVLAWGAAGHLMGLVWLGPERELAVARADAIASDAASLIPLTGWSLAIATVLVLGLSEATGTEAAWRQLAWVGAGHFAVRAWSCAYAHGAGFETRRKALLDRPWIDWLTSNLGRSGRSGDDSPE